MFPKRFHPSPSEHGALGPKHQGPSKRAHGNSASPINMGTLEDSVEQRPVRIYIIPVKFTAGTLENLASLVEKQAAQHDEVDAPNLELTADLDSADVLVTAVRTRPRLERHISWDVAVCGLFRPLPHRVDDKTS
jgi:hypothetical protein